MERNMQPVLISVTEAAKRLGVTRQAIGKAIRAGRLTAVKVGRQWCIAESDLPKKPRANPLRP